ncbi:hypothetical protein DPMN_053616 [Dreissena polymorpha]|uniref:Uncharacterized protein n=1 Tax=Dreissena polymorpha TaxID=45954 RepID=A0A9D4HQF3_DREPO|nr:hypothetical protein DPMN_053616 [Dreissena polymorpha]
MPLWVGDRAQELHGGGAGADSGRHTGKTHGQQGGTELIGTAFTSLSPGKSVNLKVPI